MLERNHLSVVMLSIVSLTVILLSTSRTDAALLAYDPVDGYASDSSIIGTPVGGSGFGGNWHWHNTQPGAFANAVSGGMTYSKNGSALQVSGDQRISQYNVNGYMRANLASSVSSGVVYMSILAMAPSDTGAPAGTYPNGTNKWGPAITINAENKEPAYFLDRDDEIHLLVFKMDFGAGTSTIWVDPEPGTTEGAPNAAQTIADDLDSLVYAFVARGGNAIQYDEIRFATTWEEVTPVPEPASMVLMGLGSLLVLSRRRA